MPHGFHRFAGTQSRYTVLEQPGGISILRIEPVRAGRDDAPYECVAENGVGDAVSADATLTIYEGKCRAVIDITVCTYLWPSSAAS